MNQSPLSLSGYDGYDPFIRVLPLVIGVSYAASAGVYFLLHEGVKLTDLIEISFPISVGGIIILYGLWLLRGARSTNTIKWVSVVLVFSIFAGMITESWFRFVISLEYDPVGEVGVRLLNSIGIALSFGVPLSYYYGSLRTSIERLRKEKERRDNLASIIVHDLRNPLNIAAGYAQQARDTGDVRYCEKVLDALDRMETIIDDTLKMARMRTKPEMSRVDLARVAEEAWTRVADRKAASLSVETNMQLLANRSRLEVIFVHLYRNAIKHGSENVNLVVGEVEDGDGFFVADDGEGVSSDLQERIFEAGFTTERGETGLGLSVVRSAVDVHGWSHEAVDSDRGGLRIEVTDVNRPGE